MMKRREIEVGLKCGAKKSTIDISRFVNMTNEKDSSSSSSSRSSDDVHDSSDNE